MSNFGFVRVAAASPKLKVANPEYNVAEISKLIIDADCHGAALIVFPELSITGYTCGDLFLQKTLLDKAIDGLEKILKATEHTQVLAIVGIPVMIQQKLYNCAAVMQSGHLLGLVPKIYLPVYKEFYEKRWFTSGQAISGYEEIHLMNCKVPFGNLVFTNEELGFTVGVEICEDLWSVIPPSSYLALKGATIIANLSASNELVSKSEYRAQLISQQSARCLCGYVYASAGVYESTTDTVYSGDCVIAENGSILASSSRFHRDNEVTYMEIDTHRLAMERMTNKSFADNIEGEFTHKKIGTVSIAYQKCQDKIPNDFTRRISPHPFIPENPLTKNERCQEIFNIQVAGLAKRLEHTGAIHCVIGVSGGLDSTLALLVTAKALEILGIPLANLVAITMPGFGTTDTTYQNAIALMQSLGVTVREIDIRPACLQHFKDIGHNEQLHDITYENTQARERTQVLMDIANQVNGLVIGTGDLSELALGWATYNGDHMSMYAVNVGVPKTLVRHLIKWIADNATDNTTRQILDNILVTPISPELLPPDEKGQIQQKTEEVVGPYELHDFFLYYMVRFGMPPNKILFLAQKAFSGIYSLEEIRKWLRVFYRRFFSQQFKRSCLPDGPKVGSISLSPRGDWRMPSDADAEIWLKELE